RFQSDHARVIPNGLDLRKFERLPTAEEARRLRGLPTDRTLLSYVGKVIPEKRLEWLLDVVRRLPDTDAVVVGGYTEEHYGDRYYRQLLATYADVGAGRISSARCPGITCRRTWPPRTCSSIRPPGRARRTPSSRRWRRACPWSSPTSPPTGRSSSMGGRASSPRT